MHNLVRFNRLVLFNHLVLALLAFAAVACLAPPALAQAPNVIISEFRYRGPNGVLDEFVEIFNNSETPVTVADSTQITGGGWALVTGDSPGVAKFVVPAGTVIPRRGRYLITNPIGYSLFAYPAGNGTTATGDGNYLADIPDNVGLALFSTADPAGFTLANRLDAAGTSAEPNALFREGAGLPPIFESDIEYTFARHVWTPCPNSPNNCGDTRPADLPGNVPQDTGDNAADFFFMSTDGSEIGAGQRLGAPSPQNLSGPTPTFHVVSRFVDATVPNSAAPNRVRDTTPDPLNNSSLGTLIIRRRFVNVSGAPVTRLRFQFVDLTTFPAAPGTSDLRVRSSTGSFITSNDPATCSPAAAPCTVFAQGGTLEEPPLQPAGGGWHSTVSASSVTLAQPLAPGQSINFEFLFGVEQGGFFRAFVLIETLPQ